VKVGAEALVRVLLLLRLDAAIVEAHVRVELAEPALGEGFEVVDLDAPPLLALVAGHPRHHRVLLAPLGVFLRPGLNVAVPVRVLLGVSPAPRPATGSRALVFLGRHFAETK
jgi:hypothetical protein